MEITKPNDIFVTSTLAPDVNVYDLLHSNIIPDNTSFFDKDTYKNTDFAKETFTDEAGKFDEIKFNTAYNKAASLYTELSNDKFLQENIEWDAFDLMRSPESKTKNQNILIAKDINPYKNLYGRTALGSVDPGELSTRELAQKSKIFDTKKGEFREESANDLGLFGSWFDDTLVYAQYDEDGAHKDLYSGREIKHRKGEYKLNEAGDFYVETLGGREIANKQVVNPTDLITTDGTTFNKIDYFDSDGKDKSIAGTTFKLATELAPLFIPGFNVYYGGFKMATGLVSVLPTLYKSLEGIILGDTTKGNETDLWKSATKAEGFMARFNADSYSDAASRSMWNYEQLGSTVVDIFSQIYEQRAAANLAKLFYKVNNTEYAEKLTGIAQRELLKGTLKETITAKRAAEIGQAAIEKIPELAKIGAKQSKLAKSLSLGYMALTSTADIYQEAINGGYDRRTAGIASLLAAGGQYTIMMNNRMGDWFLDKTVGYNVNTNRAAIKKAITPLLDDLEKGVKTMDISKEAGKRGLVSAISKVKNSISKVLLEPALATDTGEALFKNAIVEGVEEVTEQAVMDATKGVVDAMSWLGITGKKGTFNTIDTVFSKTGMETYLANLLGGVIGGGLFEINRIKIEPLITGKALTNETEYSLLRLIGNGKAEELKAEIDKRVTSIGNSNLSPLVSEVDGEQMYLFDEATPQSVVIAEAAKKYIDHLDGLLNSEELKQDDESIIKKTVLDRIRITDLEDTGIDKFILSDFNELTSQVVEIRSKIEQLDPEKDKEQISTLNKQLKEVRDETKSLLAGEKAEYYKQLSLFSLNRDLHSPFAALNVVDYAKQKHDKNFYELPENTGTVNKESVKAEFDEIMGDDSDNKKDKMKFMYSVFDEMNTRYSGLIGDYAEDTHVRARDKFVNILTNASLLTKEQLIGVQAELRRSGLTQYNLAESFNIPLGDMLRDNGYLDTAGLTPEEVESMITELNAIRLPYGDLSQEFLTKVFEAERANKLREISEKITEESAQEGADPAQVTAKYTDDIANIEKLTPRLTDPESTEFLPLDIIYLGNTLAGETEITSEVAQVVKDKIQPKLRTVKEAAKDIYLDAQDIRDRYEYHEYFDISEVDVDQVIADIYGMKAGILEDDSLAGIQRRVSELKGYVQSLEDNPFRMELVAMVEGIPDVENSFIEAEGLLGKNVVDSKLLDILSTVSFEVHTGGTLQPTNILNILKGELEALKILESPEEYIRSKDIVGNMKQAISTIGLVRSLNAAMLNSSISPENPYGFNVSIREDLTRTGETQNIDKYKVISPQASTLLNQELKRIEDKLRFLIQLSESNTATVATIQEQIRDNTNKVLTDTLTSEDNGLSAINLTIGGQKLLSKDRVSTILSQTKSEEEKLFDLEEATFLSFNEYYKEKGDVALDELFEPFNNDQFKEEVRDYIDAGFTRETKDINTLDYFNYLHSLISVNSKNFYNKYKNLLEKEVSLPTDKKAPFFGQEFSIKQIDAYKSNKRVMGHSMKFLKKLLGDNRLYLNNSFFITGSGGVGKTTVVSNLAWRLDNKPDTEVIVSAPSGDVVEKLKSDISREKEENVTSLAKNDLMKKVLGDYYDSFTEALETLKNTSKGDLSNSVISDKDGNPIINIAKFGSYEISLHEEFLEKLTNPFPATNDTVIYLDEVSWFNPLELQVIDELASQEGSRLYQIGMGDELQNGYSLNDAKPYSLETFYYNHPPKLKGVIRAKNVHKKDNTEALEVVLKNRMSNLVHPDRFALVEGVSLNYFDKTILDGDKFVDKLTVEDLNKLDKSQEIAVITEDGTIPEEYTQAFSNAGIDIERVKILPRDNIQGKEFEQVVSLFEIPYSTENAVSLYNANKQLYTLLSRGKKSSLIVGNNALLNDLGLINQAKDTTSTVELVDSQIDELLNKRFEFLSRVFKDYKGVEVEEPSQDLDKIDKEASFYEDQTDDIKNDTGDNREDEARESENVDHDGDNNYLVYSFYNVLNAYISKVDNSLLIKDREEDFVSDLQILESSISETKKANKSPEEIINEYIIAKNHLLHGEPIPQVNLFSEALSQFGDGQLVVRKLTYDEYIAPYGKQSHMKDPSGRDRSPEPGKDYLFLALKSTVFDINGEAVTGYVTLGALPDVDNPNWTQTVNKDNLKAIYDNLEPNGEIAIDGESSPLTGIRVIYSTGTSTKEGNPISISGETIEEFKQALLEKVPGLLTTDLSTLRVFDHNEQNIKDTFAEVGYELDTKKKEIANPKLLRFRPFIQVSYIDPNNKKVSKLMMLNTKKRSLLEAKREHEQVRVDYNTINKKDKEAVNKYIKGEFPALISKWSGLQLFCDIIRDAEQDPVKVGDTGLTQFSNDLIDKIINVELGAAEKETEHAVFDALTKVLDILSDAEYDLGRVSAQDKKFLLGSVQGQTKLSNLGLRLLAVLSEEDIENFNSNYVIYYNPLWKPTHTEKHEKIMDGKFIKYFELNCFLEPPIFKMNIAGVVEPAEIVEKIIEPEEVEPAEVVIDIRKATTFATPFSTAEGPVNIPADFSKWKDEDSLHRGISSVSNALGIIQSRLLALENKGASDIKNQIINRLLETIPLVLNNPALITASKDIDASSADRIYDDIVNDADFEAIDYLFDNDLEAEDYFLNSTTLKSISEINKQNNADLCK